MYKNALEENKKKYNNVTIFFDDKTNTYMLSGEWSWVVLEKNTDKIFEKLIVSNKKVTIDGSKISYMDTTGAFFIHRLIAKLQEGSSSVISINMLEEDLALLDMTKGFELKHDNPINFEYKAGIFEKIGKSVVDLWDTTTELVGFFGHICVVFATLFKRSQSLYYPGVFETVSSAGIGGIVISSLLCFLIGVNLAYQMSPQFITYGANIYIVNFLGIALLREVTPLLTAIIVAGRTGSAITASIGTMKVLEEIDALQTMGISPIRRLVIPRLIGLLISLPILTMIADVASMFGGAIVSATSLSVPYSLFLNKLQTAVSINNYTIGIFKTFTFATIIAMVGCFCGFRVKGNADSIGVQTTRSVVMSICLIVLFDAIYAIIFKVLGM
jgi:phospholipid/cholesterol/gamma-HCH transport system permease protein